MTPEELDRKIDGLLYDKMEGLDSEHSAFLPSQIASSLASDIMALVKPMLDDAYARGYKAGSADVWTIVNSVATQEEPETP